MAMTDTAAGTNRKLTRVYKTRDGKEVKQIDENVVSLHMTTVQDPSLRVDMDWLSLFPNGDPGPCMGMAAAALGLATSVGNATAAGKDWNAAQLHQALVDRWETISGGEWRSDREGGPRTAFLVEAWLDMLTAQGFKVTEATPEQLRQKIVSGEYTHKSLMDNQTFAAYYHAAEVRRAQERAAKAKEAAAAAGGGSIEGLVPEGLSR